MADFYLDEDISEHLRFLLEERGHDVMTTRNMRSKGASESAQVSLAVRFERIPITHSGTDFLQLHRAWRWWSHAWGVSTAARHPGLLVIPQSPRLPTLQAVLMVDELVNEDQLIQNRMFSWQPARGWVQIG